VREEEARQIIIAPVITEKGTFIQEKYNQYVFRVARRANRIQIKQAVEKIFDVKVEGVRVAIVKGKQRRLGRSVGFRPDWKKAVVTVKEGDTINLS
jgi:large subunit ribosomal protein L23